MIHTLISIAWTGKIPTHSFTDRQHGVNMVMDKSWTSEKACYMGYGQCERYNGEANVLKLVFLFDSCVDITFEGIFWGGFLEKGKERERYVDE